MHHYYSVFFLMASNSCRLSTGRTIKVTKKILKKSRFTYEAPGIVETEGASNHRCAILTRCKDGFRPSTRNYKPRLLGIFSNLRYVVRCRLRVNSKGQNSENKLCLQKYLDTLGVVRLEVSALFLFISK